MVSLSLTETAPLTWFDDNFQYVLLPVEYVYAEDSKTYDKWGHQDYLAHLEPDLDKESTWVEIGIHIFYNTELRELFRTNSGIFFLDMS